MLSNVEKKYLFITVPSRQITLNLFLRQLYLSPRKKTYMIHRLRFLYWFSYLIQIKIFQLNQNQKMISPKKQLHFKLRLTAARVQLPKSYQLLPRWCFCRFTGGERTGWQQARCADPWLGHFIRQQRQWPQCGSCCQGGRSRRGKKLSMSLIHAIISQASAHSSLNLLQNSAATGYSIVPGRKLCLCILSFLIFITSFENVSFP